MCVRTSRPSARVTFHRNTSTRFIDLSLVATEPTIDAEGKRVRRNRTRIPTA
jgi:hypothetical protein